MFLLSPLMPMISGPRVREGDEPSRPGSAAYSSMGLSSAEAGAVEDLAEKLDRLLRPLRWMLVAALGRRSCVLASDVPLDSLLT